MTTAQITTALTTRNFQALTDADLINDPTGTPCLSAWCAAPVMGALSAITKAAIQADDWALADLTNELHAWATDHAPITA